MCPFPQIWAHDSESVDAELICSRSDSYVESFGEEADGVPDVVDQVIQGQSNFKDIHNDSRRRMYWI